MLDKYKQYLRRQELSETTKNSYLETLKLYIEQEGENITKSKLIDYKKYLIANFKPRTVNVRIAGMNKYLKSIKKDKLELNIIKLNKSTYLENVISVADYEFLKKKLKRAKNYKGYFLIRLLCATGARVSEFCKLKIEHIHIGHFDIYGKGSKYRRIYIPYKLQREVLQYLKKIDRDHGYLFMTEKGLPYAPCHVVRDLKEIAEKYGINPNVMRPHSFRHRYAKNFIFKYKDLSLLADLLGHESIETTRIYTRQTSCEQREIIDQVVDW